MSLNINGNQLDTSYRYQMPSLKISQTGSGKNCKTVLKNLDDISDSIGCPSNILLSFLGFKSGSNVDISNYSLKGHYSESELQKNIFSYINSFVLCKCGIPELIPQVVRISKKKRNLNLKCSACGQESEPNTDKASLKTREHIIKSLEKNLWKIKKGTIVNEEETKYDELFNI